MISSQSMSFKFSFASQNSCAEFSTCRIWKQKESWFTMIDHRFLAGNFGLSLRSAIFVTLWKYKTEKNAKNSNFQWIHANIHTSFLPLQPECRPLQESNSKNYFYRLSLTFRKKNLCLNWVFAISWCAIRFL